MVFKKTHTLAFRSLHLNKEKRRILIEEKAGLWLDNGDIFGAGGEGFERINIACPRKHLKRAFKQLKDAVFEIRTHS